MGWPKGRPRSAEVSLCDGRLLVVEAKGSFFLTKYKASGKEDAARNWAQLQGAEFRLLTEPVWEINDGR